MRASSSQNPADLAKCRSGQPRERLGIWHFQTPARRFFAGHKKQTSTRYLLVLVLIAAHARRSCPAATPSDVTYRMNQMRTSRCLMMRLILLSGQIARREPSHFPQ